MASTEREPMLEMYLFETGQLLQELEQVILDSEQAEGLEKSIDTIFRIMHTIKGNSAMMLFNNIAELAHKVEDLFALLREGQPQGFDHSAIIDLVLEAVDFFKAELTKLQNGQEADGKADSLMATIDQLLQQLGGKKREKQNQPVAEAQKYYIASERPISTDREYRAVVKFSDDCDLIDVRAMSLIGNLRKVVTGLQYYPEDLIDNEEGITCLKTQGLTVDFDFTCPREEVEAVFRQTPFLADWQLINTHQLNPTPQANPDPGLQEKSAEQTPSQAVDQAKQQSADGNGGFKPKLISVNIYKLDLLMDLVGELVIAEAMVTRHPELEGLPLRNFHKAALQLRKLTNELQDVVMSVRMVPLAGTFQKMNRIVRDMNRNLGRNVRLEISGAETEVDKNIIEHISDPLMHLIRNAVDHGIEPAEERLAQGKSERGTVWLEARNSGSDVLIIVRDDGRGLDRSKILEKAKQRGLIKQEEVEMTDKEVFSLILLPGFSTNDQVTKYSGRGVGMDVVVKGLEKLGGKILIDSVWGQGTTFTLKIPLTLAIIDGMTIKVGDSLYTVPITAIRESFRMKAEELITDPDSHEMIMIRGKCYPIVRLHRVFGVKTSVTELTEGIMMMVENNENAFCLFADQLLGEQQVVVKALPRYIHKVKGIAGCTLLGNGAISLILDVAGLI